MPKGTTIAVFGTTAMMSGDPAYPGQEPVYRNDCPRHGYEVYSTGKFETALALGYDVYVVTVIPLFRPEDDWWRDLIPAERIYRPVTDARGLLSQVYDHFINAPWRRFYRDMGRAWPEGIKDAFTWRETLDGSNGILYGSRIQGYSGIAA